MRQIHNDTVNKDSTYIHREREREKEGEREREKEGEREREVTLSIQCTFCCRSSENVSTSMAITTLRPMVVTMMKKDKSLNSLNTYEERERVSWLVACRGMAYMDDAMKTTHYCHLWVKGHMLAV